jgi:hypothetical protein
MCINVISTYKLLYKALENLQQSLTCVSIGLLEILFKIMNGNSDHHNFSTS